MFGDYNYSWFDEVTMKLSAQCITIIPLDHHELTSDYPWPLLAVYSALSTATIGYSPLL